MLSGLTLYDLDAGSLPSATASDYWTQNFDIGLFEPPDPPRISWVIPSEGPFEGGNEVVIGGSGFDVSSRVLVGESEASFSITDGSTLRVVIPPAHRGLRTPRRGNSRLSERMDVKVIVITPWARTVAPDAYTYRRPHN